MLVAQSGRVENKTRVELLSVFRVRREWCLFDSSVCGKRNVSVDPLDVVKTMT